MRKILILSLITSLFAFGANAQEAKTTFAEEVASEHFEYATFFKGSARLYNSVKKYQNNIVTMKVTNVDADIPSPYVEKVGITGCFANDDVKFDHGRSDVIFAYISEANDSTDANKRYDCVLYSNADKIYTHSNAESLFSGFPALETIDLSILDTSKATNMSNMFAYNTNLKTVDLSTFDTTLVTQCLSMFDGCKSINNLDFSNFKTGNVTRMDWMFAECESLTSLDLSSFDTTNVIRMDGMFYGLTKIKRLELSNFNTSNVLDMSYMFSTCPNLEYLDISSFDCSKINGAANHPGCDGLTYFLDDDDAKLEVIETPTKIKEGYSIALPKQFATYNKVSALTSENLADNKLLDIVPGKFISEWQTLRVAGGANGICEGLASDNANHAELQALLDKYNALSDSRKQVVNDAQDIEGVTIGESIQYIKNVLAGSQTTDGDYGIKTNAANAVTNTPIIQSKASMIAIITIIGLTAVVGYYFYNKKKHAM